MEDVSYTAIPFKTPGYILGDLTNEQLAPIWDEVNTIQNSIDIPTVDSEFGGNVNKEIGLTFSLKYQERLILPYIKKYLHEYPFYKSDFDIKDDISKKISIKSATVNFQGKHDFLNARAYQGIFRYTIWLSILDFVEQKRKNMFGEDNPYDPNSTFELSYVNVLGNISSVPIRINKTFENKLILYPSKMKHTVYPYYVTDGYRISVSGNFIINH